MAIEWLDREAIVIVKAYPNPSTKHQETVCIAAVTREEGWIRLYPLNFRALPKDKQFQKYQRIKIRMRKHTKDSRPESYRPDEQSLELGTVIPAGKDWSQRWEWIKPHIAPSMCEIQRRQATEKKSLGSFRPRLVRDLVIKEDSENWSAKQREALGQISFFEQAENRLEKIPLVFKYDYLCQDDNCRGHVQSIIDWELMQLYRKLRAQTADKQQIQAKIREKFLSQVCGPERDTHFFVGNHSQHPTAFMVLGVFWPPSVGHLQGQLF